MGGAGARKRCGAVGWSRTQPADLYKSAALIEGVVADGGERRRQGERGEAAALIEGVVADGGDALGNGERAGEAAALIEGAGDCRWR